MSLSQQMPVCVLVCNGLVVHARIMHIWRCTRQLSTKATHNPAVMQHSVDKSGARSGACHVQWVGMSTERDCVCL